MMLSRRFQDKLARFLNDLFKDKPEDAGWLGIKFIDKKGITKRFMIKEYNEE